MRILFIQFVVIALALAETVSASGQTTMTLADLMFWPADEELEIVTDFRSFANAQDDNTVILREPEATEESNYG